MENNHFLYRHIRLDKNEPFYIGIGTKLKKETRNNKVIYKRAYDTPKRRNKIWKDITKKTSFEVEILLESDNYSFILQKEIEFIALYGRIDKKTGCLANMTDGGEGTLGLICSEEKARKISEANKGRIKSENERILIGKNMQKSVINKLTGEIFESIKLAAEREGMAVHNLYQGLWSFSPSCKYKYLDEKLNFLKKIKGKRGKAGIKVRNKETNQIFNTAKEAAEFENMELFKFYSCLGYKRRYFKYERKN